MDNPVPYFTNSLNALSKILAKAQTWEQDKKFKPDVVPNLRLIADMFPLWRQVTIACDHAKGASARLAGVEVPSFPDQETTLADLQERIRKTLDFIATVPAEGFATADSRAITVKAGPRELNFVGTTYFHTFAIPNFYFHMATTYAILRVNGLDVGKVDFLGG